MLNLLRIVSKSIKIGSLLTKIFKSKVVAVCRKFMNYQVLRVTTVLALMI